METKDYQDEVVTCILNRVFLRVTVQILFFVISVARVISTEMFFTANEVSKIPNSQRYLALELER